jgi:hypothetical protein
LTTISAELAGISPSCSAFSGAGGRALLASFGAGAGFSLDGLSLSGGSPMASTLSADLMVLRAGENMPAVWLLTASLVNTRTTVPSGSAAPISGVIRATLAAVSSLSAASPATGSSATTRQPFTTMQFSTLTGRALASFIAMTMALPIAAPMAPAKPGA